MRVRPGRLLRILRIMLRFRLDALIDEAELHPGDLPLGARILWALRPGRFLPAPAEPAALRLRLALETLGPVFIKFGQIVSTRRDLLPATFADELARLQDRVPPFPSATARAILERALGGELHHHFEHFETRPLASASVAQVHGATLPDGAEVVVKIIRPGIAPVIGEDIALMRVIARLLERASADARRLHLVELVDDYERTIFGELDLIREGANTAQLRRNFAESPLLYVPRVYWEYTRENVLVLERLHGVPISHIDVLRARGTDMALLAHRGVETFFIQVFEHNFFHADMHPGNIFVDIADPANPRYMAVDCAIIGSLTEEDQSYLAQNLLAFFNHDYRRVARLHLESGWVPPNTDIHEFESLIRELCEPIFERPLKEIYFGSFLVSLFQAARRFDMEVQPQLVLLQKTLINIEGLGRELYPDLDLWQTAKPFMERWMRRRMGPLAAIRRFAEQTPAMIEQLPRLPELLLDASRHLERLERLSERQEALSESLGERLRNAPGRRARQRLAIAAGLGLVMAGGALLYAGAGTGGAGWVALGAGALSAVLGSLLIHGR